MRVDAPRIALHAHGPIAWLSAAMLAHPAILLQKTKRRVGGSVVLAIALVTIAMASGVYLYPPYRARVRPHLFEDAPAIGWLFERKEHLAFAAFALALGGGASYAIDHRRRAAWAFTIATACALLAAFFGTIAAATRSF
jgi:hypothetical protein